jgi:cobyrinic acid a,c-diamide synthase
LHCNAARLLVAGLRGGSGKTLLSLGLAASLRSRGLTVAPFKKGPDYIDASWLTRAAERPCRNLDLFLFPQKTALSSFAFGSAGVDLALIEGNRGLFDGMDAEGTVSSAELAKILRAPVLLAVEVSKVTRTAAAMVLGCQTMDPEVPLAGVVLNRVAGGRHESVLRQSIEGICGVPVLGAIPRLREDPLPERHLGLVPPEETEEVEDPISRLGKVAEEYLDLDRILQVARSAGPFEVPADRPSIHRGAPHPGRVDSSPRIGVFRDPAFQFYYPENLEALIHAGAEIVEISPLAEESLPPVDGLYLGGGFPETLAPGLSENASFLSSVREAAVRGLPIYAECGGAVYLGERLWYEGRVYPLSGVFPVEFGFQERPRGHGYAILEAVSENPFFPIGASIRGHEFHHTFLQSPEPDDLDFAFRVHRGHGFGGGWDGLKAGNVLASYTHVHALGAEDWAPALARLASEFKSSGKRD